MSQASAPGKIILFGEHAVVYGQPALAVPVTQVHADVEIETASRPGIWIDAPDIDLRANLDALASSHPIAATVVNTFSALGISPHPLPLFLRERGLNIRITSSIPVASGLGSGAAVSVALIRALAQHLSQPLTAEQVSAIAYETEKLHHGTPSGIDNTVVTYARPVYFIKGQSIETFRVGKPFTIVIGDTGVSASTRESVGDLRRLWEQDKAKYEARFAAVGSLVRTARQLIENGQPEMLAPLMDENHELLQEMTVSSSELDRLVKAAKDAGALGAKLSGGGRGGNMIALALATKAGTVAKALREAGAVNTIITRIS
ncbi:MAG: mevalonate kinase [Anaerolineales bacterium]